VLAVDGTGHWITGVALAYFTSMFVSLKAILAVSEAGDWCAAGPLIALTRFATILVLFKAIFAVSGAAYRWTAGQGTGWSASADRTATLIIGVKAIFTIPVAHNWWTFRSWSWVTVTRRTSTVRILVTMFTVPGASHWITLGFWCIFALADFTSIHVGLKTKFTKSSAVDSGTFWFINTSADFTTRLVGLEAMFTIQIASNSRTLVACTHFTSIFVRLEAVFTVHPTSHLIAHRGLIFALTQFAFVIIRLESKLAKQSTGMEMRAQGCLAVADITAIFVYFEAMFAVHGALNITALLLSTSANRAVILICLKAMLAVSIASHWIARHWLRLVTMANLAAKLVNCKAVFTIPIASNRFADNCWWLAMARWATSRVSLKSILAVSLADQIGTFVNRRIGTFADLTACVVHLKAMFTEHAAS
jgi:hypothetical protein